MRAPFRFLAPVVDMFNYAPVKDARKMDSGAFYLEYHKVMTKLNSFGPKHEALHGHQC